MDEKPVPSEVAMSFFGWFRRDESKSPATPPPRGKAPPTPRPGKAPPPKAKAPPPAPDPKAAPAPAARPTLADDDQAVCQAARHISKRRLDAARSLLREVVRRSPAPPQTPKPPNPLRAHCWDAAEFAAYVAWFKKRGGRGEVRWVRPVYPRAWYYLGFLSLEAGDAETALRYLDRGLRLEPDSARLGNEKAHALLK